jgi:signal peptidase I
MPGMFMLVGLGAVLVLLALGLTAVVLRRRVTIVAVVGESMRPALTAGDRVLVRRAGIDDLRHGQVVVIEKPDVNGTWTTTRSRWPAGRREWMIKRVAAVPGDYWPSAVASASAVAACAPTPAGSVAPASAVETEVVLADTRLAGTVPPGKLVVLGDNAARSFDSRQIGYIPADRLLGVVLRPLARR